MSILTSFSRFSVFSHIKKHSVIILYPCITPILFKKNIHLPFRVTAAGVHGQFRVKWYSIIYCEMYWYRAYKRENCFRVRGIRQHTSWPFLCIPCIHRSFVSYWTRYSQVFSYVIQLGRNGLRQSCVTLYNVTTYNFHFLSDQ